MIALLLASAIVAADPATELYAAINAYRVLHGVAACSVDARLELAAEVQAKWTVYAYRKRLSYPEHFTWTPWARSQYPTLDYNALLLLYGTVPDWLSPFSREWVCGYRGTDANEVGAFLSGNAKAADFIYAWDRSPGHKAILLGDWRDMGLVKVSLAGNAVVYVDFGNP